MVTAVDAKKSEGLQSVGRRLRDWGVLQSVQARDGGRRVSSSRSASPRVSLPLFRSSSSWRKPSHSGRATCFTLSANLCEQSLSEPTCLPPPLHPNTLKIMLSDVSAQVLRGQYSW